MALVALACSGIADLHIPTPPSSQPGAAGPTTSVSLDLQGVNLTPVPIGPPTTLALTPGAASLSGIVGGPNGPVPGAIVQVERLVGDASAAKTVQTAADGTWKLAGVLGGRYRIRAWRPPDLALTTPQVVLLGAADNQQLNLTLMSFTGQTVTAAIAPDPPAVGSPASLVVTVTQQAVGGDGVVRGAPLPGASVLVSAAGNVVLAGTNPGVTDGSGRLALSLGCASPGPVGLTATIANSTSFPVAVPDCAVVVSPSTTSTTALVVGPTTTSVP